MQDSLIWRPTIAADLPALLAIADIVHPAYPEDDAIFAERLALYPLGCLTLERAGAPIGYIVSHPWTYGAPPSLNSRLGALPASPTTYYIHDIALLQRARGSGAAGEIIARLVAHAAAEGLPSLSLTAVNASVAFWRRHGFQPVADTALAVKLGSYDADARYMVRPIAPPAT
jgi:GNAT superfamily N-acetyltransferase